MVIPISHAAPTELSSTSYTTHMGTPAFLLNPSATFTIWTLSHVRNEPKTPKFELFFILITRMSFFIPRFLTLFTGFGFAF